MNDDLEVELRRALRRKEPSRDLMPRRAVRWPWTVAASVVVAALGLTEYREQQRAKEQLVFAIHLTGAKLAAAQQHVKRMQ
jgi:hypothetical protein